ncbi:cupin domain-containing protein (plasmid) [Devosia sp. A8/3-2]|nr:cupin domain-containing protein [Devosia sp. A8/3-2]
MLSDPLSQILDLLDARCVLTGGMIAKGDWVRRFPQPNALKIMAIVTVLAGYGKLATPASLGGR